MKQKLYLYMLMLTSVMLSACGQSEEDSIVEPTETVTLIIAAPQSNSTRVGDPGEAVQEGEDWDEMAVIIAYTKLEGESTSGNLPVVIKTLTKKEFEALPHYNNNPNSPYRMLALSVWRGTVHIYGVTYTGEAADSPRDAIHSCKAEGEVQNLTISNNYASGDTKKFLSVATGYYKNDDNTGDVADYVIGTPATNGEIKPIPSMRLTRLAAKIDIQWDAQDAYTQGGYTNVKVENFKYDGGATFADDATEAAKKGMGRLFPALNTSSPVLNGSATFINESEISKRNGRVYHYVFPDGVSTPKITFELSGTKDGQETTINPYTFKFPDNNKLQQATWYKINATIRGVTGTTTITQNN